MNSLQGRLQGCSKEHVYDVIPVPYKLLGFDQTHKGRIRTCGQESRPPDAGPFGVNFPVAQKLQHFVNF